MTEDLVNHPKHYAANRVEFEPVDLTERLPHPLASAVEYILRAPFKGSELLDLKKAVWWLQRYQTGRHAEDPMIDKVAAAYLHVYAMRNPYIAELYPDDDRIESDALFTAIRRIRARIDELEVEENKHDYA